jgi:hypothetical protein
MDLGIGGLITASIQGQMQMQQMQQQVEMYDKTFGDVNRSQVKDAQITRAERLKPVLDAQREVVANVELKLADAQAHAKDTSAIERTLKSETSYLDHLLSLAS